MLKTNLKLFIGIVLVLAAQACAPLTTETPVPGAVNTAVVQTIQALTLTAAPGVPVTGPDTPTPTLSAVPPTASSTSSPIPVFTFTPVIVTPSVPEISVSVPTNCRVGPGRAYARIGALLVGEVAEVVGRNAAGTYWIIVNPDRQSGTCWLWGEYATLAGNISLLHVYTPPPTPIPSPTPIPRANFEATFDGLENCASTGWWVDFVIENTGGITFESMSMTVRDLEDNEVVSLYSNDFVDRNGCDETSIRDDLEFDDIDTVSSPAFAFNLSGRDLRATITLCSELDQSGSCVTKVVSFTP